MIENILGIDLGTSSVKLMLCRDGETHKMREGYSSADTDGWWQAICRAAKSTDLSSVQAVGLSSQVGTYIVDGKDCIGWNEGVGKEELDLILSEVSRKEFIREISMPHPSIISYPLPRLKYILSHYPNAKKVCMPKDFICEMLTGGCVSDKYSWRGLASLDSGKYSVRMLSYIGADSLSLPELRDPCSIAGYVTKEASHQTGIPEGTPVYVGCNDFFSGLLGMGICNEGDMFDITGTSEHIGIIESSLPSLDDGLVSGKYFFENAHYGVTASSGASIIFGRSLTRLDGVSPAECLCLLPPIFLPYMNGERAPVWDTDARGVFFGINGKATQRELSYATVEGVAFSIYHIYECMGKPHAEAITVAGGAGKDRISNLIKASLFDIPVKVCKESDTSALGALITAAVGNGLYPDIRSAVAAVSEISDTVYPDRELTPILRARFEIYKGLYPALKDSFKSFKNSTL